jgi:hypothetical protein
VKVGPLDFSVELKTNIYGLDKRALYGTVLHSEQRILLDAEQPPQLMQSSFLHEVLHAIDDMVQAELTERQISVLAPALLMVLRDNDLLKEDDPE